MKRGVSDRVKLETVIGFFKDVLGSSFRPYGDIVIANLFKHRIDILKEREEMKIKLETEGSVEGEDVGEPEQEPRGSEKEVMTTDQSVGGDAPEEEKEEAEGEEEEEESVNSEKEQQERKDFIFNMVCLQLHMENMQSKKGFFEEFDIFKKGKVNFRDFARVLMGPYKVMILPEDLRSIINEEWITWDEEAGAPIPRPDDSFDRYNFDHETEDLKLLVDYNEFMKEIARPRPLELA